MFKLAEENFIIEKSSLFLNLYKIVLNISII